VSDRAGTPDETIDQVLSLFEQKGDEHYGEAINQRRHGLEAATVAEERGAGDVLVVAALLHDIGHFLSDLDEGPRHDMTVDDDHHEAVGARWIAPRFGPRAAQAVALHVIAKRYRCTVDPAYYETLSQTSKETLEAQGGLLTPDEVTRFEQHPGFDGALLVRDCDELAKNADMVTPELDHFVPAMRRVIEAAS
jgi:predicted HD phosphohydrolase